LAFVNIIEQRDSYTAGHTIRVAKYCRLIATELGVSEEEIVQLEKAAILHDIGKVATPDAILLKPGKLIALEYELIKQHAEAGYKMLSNIKIYEGLSELIRYHHVRYDGTGYPRTESPEEVSLLSHIMVLADAFDAMTTNRIYKPRKDVKEALKEIEYLSGKQFHPKIVEVALKALKDVEIEETKQLPINELEKKRFAYFFEDALTNYYNESYLQVILSDENRTANNLYIIYLKKFSEFNKKNGWIEGNRFLKEVADLLHQLYSNALLFRYRGDDFVILKADDTPIDIYMINDYDFIKSSGVSVLVRDVTLHKESYSVEELEQ
jgi:putative nucleotidyltransferase with HDIG domain